ncbi:hypothetical protein DICSQDRAFT_61315 [Dichomitus squalens LYAD-421 SS1]|uniref:RNA polymerase I-specific transcription initiation factor Rrn7 n=1 Tax=Dichomitus squalens (strain LYAD-421) TaxID=732165 RepID=R7SZT3_DICSQ|nr:uncharacterized protein DICSQDRAFT_61315 [Dichomitus squalens LYAD-421 SS1]EJF61215.1 hypothetical protein DICSQDRAFT_61315 [Dichomitus squalens LYAD-421 SS1]
MARRGKCSVCGSKQWHKSPSSGLIMCSEGHVLQNYRNETTEVTELGPHHMRKRTLKSGREKKERQSKADPKVYHGERARFHFYQCLQLILRMQAAALTRLWQLPPEFERICRDIWALHLSLLPNPPVAEPLLYLQDGLGPSSSKPSAKLEREQRGKDSDGHESEHSKKSEMTADSSSSDSSSDFDYDSGLDELMRENSATPSSSEQEDEGNPKKRKGPVPITSKRPTFSRHDTPASTISVLVVACWTLRLPVMYIDFIRIIESYDLPYLDALRLVPEAMLRHLRKQTAQALSPFYPPSTLYLHNLSSRLSKLMYSTYDVYTPEMNAAPILWKAVRSLQGTPTLYVLTKRLARLVSIPLTLHRTLAPALKCTKKRDPGFHKHDNAVPEVSLIATVIVVMKMVYGMDGQLRRPRENEDPACALPTLKDVLRAIKNAEAADLKHAPAFSMETQRSVLDMDDKMLDEYLAFCEKALLPREDNMPRKCLVIPSSEQQRIKVRSSTKRNDGSIPSNPTANAIDEGDNHLRPGEQYAIYSTQDLLGSFPADMELVFSRAAKWAGVDDNYVSGVVERFERRVLRWWDRQQRKERAERATASASD